MGEMGTCWVIGTSHKRIFSRYLPIVICGNQGQAWAGLLFREGRVSVWGEERLLEVDGGDGSGMIKYSHTIKDG